MADLLNLGVMDQPLVLLLRHPIPNGAVPCRHHQQPAAEVPFIGHQLVPVVVRRYNV